jgi:hypothetical protein
MVAAPPVPAEKAGFARRVSVKTRRIVARRSGVMVGIIRTLSCVKERMWFELDVATVVLCTLKTILP